MPILKSDTTGGFRPHLAVGDDIGRPAVDCLRWDGVLETRLLSPNIHEILLGLSRVRNAVSSFRLEGETVELNRARELLEGREPATPSELGVLRLAREYSGLSPGHLPEVSLVGILGLHRTLFDGNLQPEWVGILKPSQNYGPWARYFVGEVHSAYKIAAKRANLGPLVSGFSKESTRVVLRWILAGDGSWFSRGDYPNPRGYSLPALWSSLNELVRGGLLEAEGQKRGRRCRLRSRFPADVYTRTSGRISCVKHRLRFRCSCRRYCGGRGSRLVRVSLHGTRNHMVGLWQPIILRTSTCCELFCRRDFVSSRCHLPGKGEVDGRAEPFKAGGGRPRRDFLRDGRGLGCR